MGLKRFRAEISIQIKPSKLSAPEFYRKISDNNSKQSNSNKFGNSNENQLSATSKEAKETVY